MREPDLAGDYLRGAAIGAQLSESRQRLAAENNRVAMEANIRSQTLQQESLREQVRIQTQKAYHDSQIGLQQQHLAQIQQVNAMKIKQAAMKVAAQQKLNGLLRAGVPLDKALYQVPELSSPTLINEIERQAQQHADSTRRMNLTESGQAIANKRLDNQTGLQTVTKEVDATEGKPAVDAQPASSGILGFGAHPAIPGSAAVPALPKRKITTRIKVGSDPSEQTLPASPDTTTAPDDAAPPADGTGQPAPTPDSLSQLGGGFVKGYLAGGLKESTPLPKKGDVYKGHTFLGGNPADKSNWQKVEEPDETD